MVVGVEVGYARNGFTRNFARLNTNIVFDSCIDSVHKSSGLRSSQQPERRLNPAELTRHYQVNLHVKWSWLREVDSTSKGWNNPNGLTLIKSISVMCICVCVWVSVSVWEGVNVCCCWLCVSECGWVCGWVWVYVGRWEEIGGRKEKREKRRRG